MEQIKLLVASGNFTNESIEIKKINCVQNVCIICRDGECDYVQWAPAETLSAVATGFYGREDEWLPAGWKQKIKI